MKRRTFIALATAISLTPMAALADEGWITYQPGVIAELLANGDTVFVDYSATWCSTCKAQGRTIDALRDDNPDFSAAMQFVRVDWDTYGREDVTTSRNIPRRSTLIVLRGDAELGRIVAGTRRADIQALLELGV
ncbi:MAG: thioredoxin family protein [Rhodobacteraceae bacterium]|nr:thioredoxin family protein [Paracoccaceae bacterium]